MRQNMHSPFGPIAPLVFLVCALALAPAGAVDTEDTSSQSQSNPDYMAAKAAIREKNWKGAIQSLHKAAAADGANADVQNLLGYSYRHMGQFKEAFAHYKEALRLNPRHRGAHEYIGEAYLQTNDLAKAQEHLAALDRLCLFPCEEYKDLKKSVEAYKRKK
jgi:Flp pilus assembly protein TadD